MYGVLGNLVLLAAAYGLSTVGTKWASALMVIVGVLSVPYAVFVAVAIWRCAWNSSWIGWGYIARTVVAIGVVRFVVGFVAVFV